MLNPLFRPALISDANQIHHGVERAFIPLYDKFYENGYYPYFANRNWIAEKIMNQFVYVAELEQNIVGAVFIFKNPDELHLYVHSIYIDEGLRREGLGTFLLLNAEAVHSDAYHWSLETISNLPGSAHFFEKLGYIRYGLPKLVNADMTVVYYKKGTA